MENIQYTVYNYISNDINYGDYTNKQAYIRKNSFTNFDKIFIGTRCAIGNHSMRLPFSFGLNHVPCHIKPGFHALYLQNYLFL